MAARRSRLNPTLTRLDSTASGTTVSAADPAFGLTRDLPQIMNAVGFVVAAGGGTVQVPRYGGPWTIGRNHAGVQIDGGILIEDSNVTLVSDGAVLNLNSNCDFIKIRSVTGTRVTITADTAITDSTLTVTSSATFSVGQWVFVRLGQAVYDGAEPDGWLYAKVLAIPDATHVTLDQAVGYAMSVADTPTVGQRSVTPLTKFVENVAVEGVWNLVNPMTGSANAEAGVNLQIGRNLRVGTIIGTDTGAAAVGAQFIDGLQIDAVKSPSALAQNGQASKGRVVSFAECRGVNVGLVQAEGFERSVVVVEGRCQAIRIDKLQARNTFPGRAGNIPLIGALSNNQISIGALHLSGNNSLVYNAGGTTGNEPSIDHAYFFVDARPNTPMAAIKNTLFFGGQMYPKRAIWRRSIPLVPNMTDVTISAPAGYFRTGKVYASSTVGVTAFRFGSSAVITNDLAPLLVTGQTANLDQAANMGGGYNVNADATKRVIVSTDSTVPEGAYLVVEVDYFTDPTAPGDDDIGSWQTSPTFSGPVSVRGALGFRRTPVATSYAMTDADLLIAVTSTSAPRTITLLSAVGRSGRMIEIKDESGAAGTNAITVATSAGQTIDGAGTISIGANWASSRLYSDGMNWHALT